jgi:hypothetical protein
VSAVDRAAEILRQTHAADRFRTDTLSPAQAAQALAAAGLLVTDEIQAVLDAVETWKHGPVPSGNAMIDVQLGRVHAIDAAFDAYLASRAVA